MVAVLTALSETAVHQGLDRIHTGEQKQVKFLQLHETWNVMALCSRACVEVQHGLSAFISVIKELPSKAVQ